MKARKPHCVLASHCRHIAGSTNFFAVSPRDPSNVLRASPTRVAPGSDELPLHNERTLRK